MIRDNSSALERKANNAQGSRARTPSGTIVYSTRKGFVDPKLKRVKKHLRYQPAEPFKYAEYDESPQEKKY